MKYHYKVTSDTIKDVPIITIEGDLTSEADGDVKKLYNEFKEKNTNKKLIINFNLTKYINSSGIATLINIIQDVNESDGVISFVGMSDHLHKVMDIVGISDFVQIYKTNEEAVSAM